MIDGKFKEKNGHVDSVVAIYLKLFAINFQISNDFIKRTKGNSFDISRPIFLYSIDLKS